MLVLAGSRPDIIVEWPGAVSVTACSGRPLGNTAPSVRSFFRPPVNSAPYFWRNSPRIWPLHEDYEGPGGAAGVVGAIAAAPGNSAERAVHKQRAASSGYYNMPNEPTVRSAHASSFGSTSHWSTTLRLHARSTTASAIHRTALATGPVGQDGGSLQLNAWRTNESATPASAA
jgi:hypothetical protein